METRKSHARRVAEGWFDRWVVEPILDVGCGEDPLTESCSKFDQSLGHGDATHLASVPDGIYGTVYASHILEHLMDPGIALKNWFRVLRPGGRLIICVPHRDLYEKRNHLPSRWNLDHKTFWLPFTSEPPCTFGLVPVLRKTLPRLAIELVRILDDGWTPNGADTHSVGEFSIELIGKKS